jgi:hypothetical protein
MQRPSTFLLLVLLLNQGVAAAAEAPAPPASDRAPATAAPPADDGAPPEPVYTPSERISADSAVTFPVDI